MESKQKLNRIGELLFPPAFIGTIITCCFLLLNYQYYERSVIYLSILFLFCFILTIAGFILAIKDHK